MDNTYEELYKIYTQECLNGSCPRDRISIVSREIFAENGIIWSFWDDRGGWYTKDGWEVFANVDFHTRETYQLDVIDYKANTHSRWVNWKYKRQYVQNLFDHQIDSAFNSYDMRINIQYGLYSGDIVQKIKDVIAGRNDPADHAFSDTFYEGSDEETIELDMTDAEIALIARAAHAEDITINQFMNKVIKEELDKVLPDWRDDVRASHI